MNILFFRILLFLLSVFSFFKAYSSEKPFGNEVPLVPGNIKGNNDYSKESSINDQFYFFYKKTGGGYKVGIADTSGKVFLPDLFEKISNVKLSNTKFLLKFQSKFGLFDIKKLDWDIALEYQEISLSNNDFIVKKNGKYGFLDSNYNVKLECIYFELYRFSNPQFIRVQSSEYLNDQKCGLYDLKADKFLFPTEYYGIKFDEDKFFTLYQFGKLDKRGFLLKGIADLRGKIIIPVTNLEIKITPSGGIIVRNGSTQDIYSYEGKLLIRVLNSYIFSISSNNFLIVLQDGKQTIYSCINGVLKDITPVDVEWLKLVLNDEYSITSDVKLIIKKEGKYGIVNGELNQVIATDKDSISVIETNRGYYFFLTKSGDAAQLYTNNGSLIIKNIQFGFARKHILHFPQESKETVLFFSTAKGDSVILYDLVSNYFSFPNAEITAIDQKNSLFSLALNGKYKLYDFSKNKYISDFEYDLIYFEQGIWMGIRDGYVVKIERNQMDIMVESEKIGFQFNDTVETSSQSDTSNDELDKVYVFDGQEVSVSKSLDYSPNTTVVRSFNMGEKIDTFFVFTTNRLDKGFAQGLATKSGQIVFPPVFNYINPLPFKDATHVVVKGKRVCGLLNLKTLNWDVPLVYEEIEYMSPSYLRVKKNDRYGIIDSTGKVVLDVIYSFINFESLDRFCIIVKDDFYGVYDLKEKQVVIPVKYGNINKIGSSFFKTTTMQEQITYVDKNGKSVFPSTDTFTKCWSCHFYGYPKLSVAVKNGWSGVINEELEQIIPFKYKSIINILNNYFVATDQNNYKGILSWTGEIIIPFKYEHIGKISSKTLFTFKDQKYGMFTEKMKNIEPIYDFMDTIDRQSLILVGSNNKYGYLNGSGDKVIEVKYDTLYSVFENRKRSFLIGQIGNKSDIYRLDGKMVFTTTDGTVIGKFNSSPFYIIKTKLNELNIIDIVGTKCLENDFDEIVDSKANVIIYKSKGKCFMYDLSLRKLLLRNGYDTIYFDDNNRNTNGVRSLYYGMKKSSIDVIIIENGKMEIVPVISQ